MAEVAKLIKDIDANKTLSSNDEIKFCCRSILDDHPSIKVEEVRACFNMIRQGKFGKLFERLKTAEILDALRRYEGEVRTEIMEHQIKIEQGENKSQYKGVDGVEPLNLVKQFQYLWDAPDPVHKSKNRSGTRLREKMQHLPNKPIDESTGKNNQK